MTTTAIACKQPKVTYLDGTHHCQVPGCGWTFRSVKSAEEARWHKAAHRAAVPKTVILSWAQEPGTFVGQCGYSGKPPGCGGQLVVRGPHVQTYADCRRYLSLHLIDEHGLVTCP